MQKSTLGAIAFAFGCALCNSPVNAQGSTPMPASAVTPAVVNGALKSTSGMSMSSVSLELRAPDGRIVASAVTDRRGGFRFDTVAPGSYTIAGDGVEIDAAQRKVTVSAVGPVELALVATRSADIGSIQVIAARLNEARQLLAPDIGADVYRFDRKDITDLPGGAATPLNDVLLQASGVTQDSFGQLHVRGDHANLQYRLNGIILPESIAGFGQTISTRFIDQMSLITGALPAQYGYRTAGVVDITTKGGALDAGTDAGYYGGSHATNNVFADSGGAFGQLTYYAIGSLTANNLGIEAPTPDPNPLHDRTTQENGFGYFSYAFDADTRLSLIAGAANNNFQIPNIPGQTPTYVLQGAPDLPSSDLDENQTEKTRLAVLALQGVVGDAIGYQIAAFCRYSSALYVPDPVGDLTYTGVAGQIYRQNTLYGAQGDMSYKADRQNTVRAGFYLSSERIATNNTSQVFPADADGNQTSTVPFTIVDNTSAVSRQLGVYLQDEWQPLDDLTVNFGIRYDDLNSFVAQSQWSPRIGAVYKVSADTTIHAGYARYFTPPPSELITDATIAKFEGTTNAQPSTLNSPVRSESSNYFDVGVTQQMGRSLTLGLDGYYRVVTDLLDEGQFGSALLFTPFNYADGRVYGVELTSSYRDGNFSAYANLAYSKAQGKNIVSSQYNFDPDELAYIASHYIYLDHNQTWTGSAGASYLWNEATFSASLVYGSGLRSGFANSDHLPAYTQVNVGVFRPFDIPAVGKITGRFTIVNIFDQSYELRDGTGVGVGAPQFGPRRAYYAGVEKAFK